MLDDDNIHKGLIERLLTHRMAMVVACSMCILIWGTTWAAIRVGLSGIPPFRGAAMRFAIAGVLLLILALIRRVPLGKAPMERWLWVINGTLSFSASYGTVYWAEQWLPSGLTSIIFATFPLCVAALAHYWLPGENLRLPSVLGIMLGFCGIAVIFSEDLTMLGGPGTPLAAVVMLSSPVVSALGSVMVKRFGKGIHPLSLTSVPMIIGSVLLWIFSAALERGVPTVWTAASVGSLIYLALAGSAVTFLLYFWLLQRMEATRLSLIAYVTPVLSIIVGMVFMGEKATMITILGSAIVVAGVVMASRRKAPPVPAEIRTASHKVTSA